MIKKVEFKRQYRGKYSGEWAIAECDNCGTIFERLLKRLKLGEIKYKGQHICKSCAYTKKYKKYKTGKDSKFYKNGISQHGYRRIYHDGKNCYEHKVVAEKKLGRPIKKGEIIHHIDCDKLNNHPDNLYVFSSRKEHEACHCKMESLGQSLLNDFIWFNSEKKEYALKECCNFDPIKFYGKAALDVDYSLFRPKRRLKGTSKWIFVTINGIRRAQHAFIVESVLGRPINRMEDVHHINGNKWDNRIENLILVSRSDHRKIHESLCTCIGNLFKKKVISFVNGRYYKI